MTLLTVTDVHVRFARKAGLLARLRRSLPPIHAVDGVSFEVAPGEVLGVAGGSGSGKSSLAFAIMGHHPLHGGTITVAGQPVVAGDRARLRRLRRDVQLIFQDPYQSLNPLFDIERVVSEPLRIMVGTSGTALRSKVVEALGLAGLRPAEKFLARYPHELSGGQRQRVAIARAIIVEPKLLIADEPTSMLDVSVRAGILKLLVQHAEAKRIGILYISHDLATMKQICDRIAVMHRGQIVEIGPADEVITQPKHDYTRSLVAAVPNFRF